MTGRYEFDGEAMVQLWNESDAREELQNEDSEGWQIDVKAGEFAVGHTQSEARQSNRTFERGETLNVESTRSEMYMHVRDTSVPIDSNSNAEKAIVVVSYQGFAINVTKRIDRAVIDNVQDITLQEQLADDVHTESITVDGNTSPSSVSPAPGKETGFKATEGNNGNIYIGNYTLTPGSGVTLALNDPSVITPTSDNDTETLEVVVEVNN